MRTSYIFKTAPQLRQCIDDYFTYIKGEPKPVEAGKKRSTSTRVLWLREPEPPTISSLLLYLGFCSKDEFTHYENSLIYSKHFRYAKLRIAAAYEQLLFEKPTATIFALKNMGWTDKPTSIQSSANKTLKVEITTSGPKPAGSEKEVNLLI